MDSAARVLGSPVQRGDEGPAARAIYFDILRPSDPGHRLATGQRHRVDRGKLVKGEKVKSDYPSENREQTK